MEYIFSPWRYQYVTSSDRQPGCVFCHMLEAGDDEKSLILVRAQFNFIVLNRYPYTSGHLMIVPYEHESSLAALADQISTEMMQLTKRSQTILQAVYQPDGFNIGVNLGKSAGAGVAQHVHLHVVPRWHGDANFVSVVGETRIMPEDLSTSYQRLQAPFTSSI